MIHALIQNGPYVAVRKGVKYGFAVPPAFDQLALFQYAQLMGNGALRHAEQRGDVANAHLTDKQAVQNPDSGRVAEHFEQFAQVKQNALAGHFLVDFLHDVLVNMQKIAAHVPFVCRHFDHLFATIEHLFICMIR